MKDFVKEILPQDAVKRMIMLAGDDPNRPGLEDTPRRVVKAYQEMFTGYSMEVELTMFDNPHPGDGIIVQRDIEFYSTCEHHMLPFYGVAHVGYLPNSNKRLGASKPARLIDKFSRRLTMQEDIGIQVVNALMDAPVNALGAGVVLVAKHLCINCRGVSKQHSEMITSHVDGSFDLIDVRQEWMALIGRSI